VSPSPTTGNTGRNDCRYCEFALNYPFLQQSHCIYVVGSSIAMVVGVVAGIVVFVVVIIAVLYNVYFRRKVAKTAIDS